MQLLTGRSLNGTKTSSQTSDGCQPRHQSRKAHTLPTGSRSSRCPSMIRSGTIITLGTVGTANALSKLLMNLSTVLMTWNLPSHSVDLKTILAKTDIRSLTSTRISQVIAAVVLPIRREALATALKQSSWTGKRTAITARLSMGALKDLQQSNL